MHAVDDEGSERFIQLIFTTLFYNSFLQLEHDLFTEPQAPAVRRRPLQGAGDAARQEKAECSPGQRCR